MDSVGRPDATQPAPDLTVPEPFGALLHTTSTVQEHIAYILSFPLADSVDSILARFDDAGGFSTVEVVWLLISFVLRPYPSSR